MIKRFESNKARLRRHQRIRRHLKGTASRPRLNVFRSGHHIYAQVIDDATGQTLVAASSLEESLHDFNPAASQADNAASSKQQASAAQTVPAAEVAAEAPAEPARGKARGGSGGGGRQSARQAPAVAEKKVKRPPVEQLAAIANNRKVAIAREVGKLVAQRAKEKGVTQVVFDRGGYAYHGRVAALAEGAREVGLNF